MLAGVCAALLAKSGVFLSLRRTAQKRVCVLSGVAVEVAGGLVCAEWCGCRGGWWSGNPDNNGRALLWIVLMCEDQDSSLQVEHTLSGGQTSALTVLKHNHACVVSYPPRSAMSFRSKCSCK